jgi:hypothetical protein
MTMAEFKPKSRHYILGTFVALYSGAQVFFTAYNASQKSTGPTRTDIFIIAGFLPLTILGAATIARIVKIWRIQKSARIANDE